MKNTTNITVILDRSGSMCSIARDMQGGFDAFIAEQKKVTADSATVTLVQFDDRYEVVYKDKDIKEVGPLELIPRGGTALHDAVGQTVDEVGAKFASLPESERPERVVFVVITDGEENASRNPRYHNKIKDMIEHQQTKYNWQFIFLGSNQDAVSAGAHLGMKASNSVTFANNSAGIGNTYSSLSSKMCMFRSTNNSASLSYNDDDRAKAMGEDDDKDLKIKTTKTITVTTTVK